MRVLLLVKQGLYEVQRLIHPRAMLPVRLGHRVVEPADAGGLGLFRGLYHHLQPAGLWMIHTGLDPVSPSHDQTHPHLRFPALRGCGVFELLRRSRAQDHHSEHLFKAYDGPQQIWLTAIVNALILLPFILLFTPSGYLADRWPKNHVMRISAWVAVGISLAITACYYLGLFWPAFAMTFVLALQSAIYSPSKFGYIKELAGIDALTTANAWVQASSSTPSWPAS
jgi:hypothetical protein